MDKTLALCPLFDGDSFIYRVGFASKADEPLEHCLHSVKTVVQRVLDKFPQREWYKMYIAGKGNYRNDIATMFVYKGNRDPDKKPFYYKEIREYLIEHWGAVPVNGMEADDAVGIEQYKYKDKSTVIVGQDKDLKMLPGYHYNWVKDTLNYITYDEGMRFFLRQMLIGDNVDNVPGIAGIGERKAPKYIPDTMPLNEAVAVVEREYQKQYKDHWRGAITEVANLLWIRRDENKLNPFWST